MSLKLEDYQYAIGLNKLFDTHKIQINSYWSQDRDKHAVELGYKKNFQNGNFLGLGLNVENTNYDYRKIEKSITLKQQIDETHEHGIKIKVFDDENIEKEYFVQFKTQGKYNLGVKAKINQKIDKQILLSGKIQFSDQTEHYGLGFDFSTNFKIKEIMCNFIRDDFGVKMKYQYEKNIKEFTGYWQKNNHKIQAGIQYNCANPFKSNQKIGFMWNIDF